MHLLALAVFAPILLSSGCRQKADLSTSECLAQLQQVFGIPWPTHYTNDHAGSYTYSARDNPHNVIVVTRLEVEEADFKSWQAKVEEQMSQYEGIAAVRDNFLLEKFPWWNPHEFPAAWVTRFWCKTNVSNHVAKLDVDAVKSNSCYLLFIQSD